MSHFFNKINVAVIELSAPLKVGDTIAVRGMTTSFDQSVDSMQIEHDNVDEAKKGDSVGLRVANRVREGDIVYMIKQ